MKNLIIAFFIVLLGAVITFAILSVFEIQKEIAGTASGIFFGGISYVHQILDKRSLKPNLSALPTSIVTLDKFGLAPVIMATYGVLILFAVGNVGGVLGAVVAATLNLDKSQIGPSIMLFSGIFVLYCAYVVGHWIGSRCRTHGILVTLVVVLCFRILATTVDINLLSNEDFLSVYGEQISFSFLLQQIFSGILIIGGTALIGYWVGRKKRMSRYLSYLLRFIPNETRNDLLQLAYEEVKNMSEKEIETHDVAKGSG